MKFFININQLALAKTGLDLKDAAILDYLIGFCSAEDRKVKHLQIKEENKKFSYTWINYRHLTKEMPLLKIKNPSAISRRIKKIKQARFIKTNQRSDNTLFVRLTEKTKELEFTKKGIKYWLQRKDLLTKNKRAIVKKQ